MNRLLAVCISIGIGLYPVSLRSSLVEVVVEEPVNKLVEILKRHEGVKHLPYRDSVGVLTIGCGRNISTNKKHKGLGLSIDEIEYMLQNDIERNN